MKAVNIMMVSSDVKNKAMTIMPMQVGQFITISPVLSNLIFKHELEENNIMCLRRNTKPQ